MVTVIYDRLFKKKVSKIKDHLLKEKIKKQIVKLFNDPELGKPMKYSRKGTREVYVPPYRLSYSYLKDEDIVVLLDFYHKDGQ